MKKLFLLAVVVVLSSLLLWVLNTQQPVKDTPVWTRSTIVSHTEFSSYTVDVVYDSVANVNCYIVYGKNDYSKAVSCLVNKK